MERNKKMEWNGRRRWSGTEEDDGDIRSNYQTINSDEK